MRPIAGVTLHPYVTILRAGQEYPVGLNLAAPINQPEEIIFRLRNTQNIQATWGLNLSGNGHALSPSVRYGGGELTSQGRVAAFKEEGTILLSLNAAGDPEVNITVDPGMWVEFRSTIVWANVTGDPAVALVPEIPGVRFVHTQRDPNGHPTTAVIPVPTP